MSACWQMAKMKEQLKQQAEQQVQRQLLAPAADMLHTAAIPKHWDAWESAAKHDTVQLVVLPLPAGEYCFCKS